nr:hypothetical protein [Tanacetum cinerariifolium]
MYLLVYELYVTTLSRILSSITAQQSKLDLELIPKENRLDIKKCNGRIPHGLTPRKPTFQVVLDAIALISCYPVFLITADVPEVYMYQFWNSVYKHDTFYRFNLDKKKQFKLTLEVFRDIFYICPRVQGRDFDALPFEEDVVSFLRELVYTREINSLNDDYKTYLGYALGVVPPKIARKFKKASPSKKDSSLITVDDEPIKKGIKLLSEVALAEKAQMKEVRKKSLRDFHKKHPSGSGTVAKKPLRVDKITPTVISEGTGDKPGVPDVTEDDSTKSESDEKGSDSKQDMNGSESDSESDQQEYEEVKDDDKEEDKIVHTPSNSNDEEDANLESKNDDTSEGDEDRGMDDTTNQFNDDVQDKEPDVEMTDAQQEKGNLEITQEHVVEDAHVTIPIVAKETEVPDASFSPLSDLASKFQNFLDIHPNDAELFLHWMFMSIIKHKSQPKSSRKNVQSEVLEFEVVDTYMPQDQGWNLGNDDDEAIKESASKRDWFTKPTRPQEPTDPDWNVGKTPKKGPTQSCLMTLAASSSTDKSLKSFDELMSTLIYFYAYIMNCLKISNLTQETLLGPAFRLLKGIRSIYAELEYDFEECYKALLEKLDWENPKGDDYTFDLTKPLPLVKVGNRLKVPADYFFKKNLKYLQGGISTMTYTTSLTKTKAAYYDLPGFEDMVPNIWSLVKVSLDRYAKWVTRVDVIKKDGYGYLREIEVRRTDNVLYTFKEGDFLRFRLNDIEDMLILVAQNWLTNLSSDDVDDFAIALKILERNRLMHSVKLYKFSDGTLTRRLTSLEDITKNIYIRYLPKRRWSSLEKKRAHFMIKEINKLLKDRRTMQSLEKFIGGERKPRKGQNQIKTRQKREACQSREKFKAVAVGRARKTEQNTKRMAKNANAVKSYSNFKRKKKRKGARSAISP